MNQREAVLRLARESAARVLRGELSPYLGNKRIAQLALAVDQDVPELDLLIYIADQWESRPEDRPLFERAISDAARQLVGGT